MRVIQELAKLCLNTQLPDIEFLSTNSINKSVTLTNRQVLCLVSHMFFCTTVEQRDGRPRDVNERNFKYWLMYPCEESNVKLTFVFNYFIEALKDTTERFITYYRHGIDCD
jgi:hypothetical protein